MILISKRKIFCHKYSWFWRRREIFDPTIESQMLLMLIRRNRKRKRLWQGPSTSTYSLVRHPQSTLSRSPAHVCVTLAYIHIYSHTYTYLDGCTPQLANRHPSASFYIRLEPWVRLPDERVNEGTSERGNKWTREQVNEGTSERGKEGTREGRNEWMRERVNEGTSERGNEWTRKRVNEWTST